MSRILKTAGLVGSLALAATVADSAHACGGTFCDSGPQAMPVDQTGENILFVLDGENVEAHIQIQYQGEAEKFAWVVPVPAIPTVTVGSQLLFDQLLQGTVPSYGFNTSRDVCGDPSSPGFGAGGFAGAGGGSNAGNGGSAGSSSGGGPDIVFQESVGAFEVVALQGGTAQEVVDWLDNNGYQSVDTAPDILQEYVEKNHVFVALKLRGGAGVEEIHPIVVRYKGDEPCVPIKLTRVAAVEDMGIRTFFLGTDRFVPTNYKHVRLNPFKLDWPNQGSNYNELVARAVDSKVANGQAFVTEYAGTNSVVSRGGFYRPVWATAKLNDIDPTLVVDELQAVNLMACYGNFDCDYFHPLLKPILNEYLPRPAGVSEGEFYSCLSCYSDQIDTMAWDAQQFAADFDERIVQPAKKADALFDQFDYLTRMYTTMSPVEMTLDPMFHQHKGLDDVSRRRIATRRILCDGNDVYSVPDGEEVALKSPQQWPEFEKMPLAEVIEEYQEGEAKSVILVDNRDDIRDQVTAHNKALNWPDTAGNGTGGTNSGTGGANSSGGAGADPDAATSSSGCGCAAPGDNPTRTGGLLLTALGLAGAFARRRSRR